MKSDRVSRRATKRRGNNSATAEQSECVNKSQAVEEPDMGHETQPLAADDITGDARDGVEFPEAVVLVGKTHWRCVTCRTLNPRTNSIDDHMNRYHKQPESPALLSCQDEGQGLEQDQTCEATCPVSANDVEHQPVQSCAYAVSALEGQSATCEKEAVISKQRLAQRKGRNTQRARGSTRGRGRGGRGRGRLTKPAISEDSDTEIEVSTFSPPPPAFASKENTESFSAAVETIESTGSTQTEQDITAKTVDDVSPPPSKKAKLQENNRDVDVVSPNEMVAEVTSPDNLSWTTLKELMKAKYVMFVKKGGTMDIPLESEVHIDNDPLIPIETPSLQADAFLPPATPLLPDIHGQPETPIPPDTPHPLELSHQPNTLSPSEISPGSEQDVARPQFVPSAVLLTKSAIVSEHLFKSEEIAREDDLLVSSETLIANKLPDKESTSASVCWTCGAVFDLPDNLAQHQEEMLKFDIVSCNSCGEKFHGLHRLNIHVFTAHEEWSKKFCFLCDADCVDVFGLEDHLLKHSVETDAEDNGLRIRHHRCKTCGQELIGNESDLINHYSITHGDIFCAKCYNLFHDSMEYEQHRSVHISYAHSVIYSCPVTDCYQLCKDKEALMDHISWHEDRDLDEELQSLVQCHYCSDQFRNITSLQCHLAETHNEPDLRPFVCELCKEGFSCSVELHEHNRIHHAGIKRFGCAYCHQRFAFPSAHSKHVASAHDVAATVLRL